MGQTFSALGRVLFSFLPDQFFSKLELPDYDLAGRTYLITGSNTGLGLAAAIHLARLNATHLVLGVRDLNKGEKAKNEIIAQTKFAGTIDIWELDMARFDSVTSFAEKAKNSLIRLDGALVNAGIAKPERWETTADGWEKTLQVNGIATGLLAVLLLPLLQATTRLPPPHPDASQLPPHLTITGSAGQFLAQFREKRETNILKALNDSSKWATGSRDRYFVTKIFNLFLARQISTLPEAEGVVINVVDPGLCMSDIGQDRQGEAAISRSYLFRAIAWPVSKGSINMIYAVLSPTPPGAYISSCEIRQPPAWTCSKDGMQIQQKVWDEMVEVWRGVSPEMDNIVRV
ncbi:hypothetical protein C8R44DRAFT_729350 [Mycena epipterygia]|nr:hypothetical protein C8R44DRAFT_729350 [Mycena epipterygia]